MSMIICLKKLFLANSFLTHPLMSNYQVRIQVIKVYDIYIEAANEDDAISEAYTKNSKWIQQNGDLVNIDTDYAMIYGVADD